MLVGHAHNYFADAVGFGAALIPFLLIALLIVAAALEEPLRVRAAARRERAAGAGRVVRSFASLRRSAIATTD